MTGFRPRFFLAASDQTRCEPTVAEEGEELCQAEVVLADEDSHHALHVLRLGKGDQCEVVVGTSVYAATVVAAVDPVRVRLGRRLEGAEAGAFYRREVGLVQALARSAVMDYVLQKGTEVGASFFILVRAARSSGGCGLPPADRLARWRRIVREAAQQSKQTAVPHITVAGSLDEALASLETHRMRSLVLEPSGRLDLREGVGLLEAQVAGLALWVGPEGGWTAAELQRFVQAGVGMARLGRSVLRAETAGPVGVAVARATLGDW